MDGREHIGLYDAEKAAVPGYPFRDVCGKCGARRIDRQLGLEPTAEAYLAAMVEVFRAVRRVLRDDGTCWVNIGDSYAANGMRQTGRNDADTIRAIDANSGRRPRAMGYGDNDRGGRQQLRVEYNVKPKDLLLMPARLALALQADGWFIRSQMPWLKRSCMPESATDRPTSAIEYVYMLTKKPRYFWDAEAVKRSANGHQGGVAITPKESAPGLGVKNNTSFREAIAGPVSSRNFRNSDLFFDSLEVPYGMICDANGLPLAMDVNPAAFKESHFATFPPKLIEPLIRAGTSERGCCAACGAPWVRVTERSFVPTRTGNKDAAKGIYPGSLWAGSGALNGRNDTTTTGWRASCACEADVVPCTVLDPFVGSGTTALVADRLQRDAIGIDLSIDYAAMAQRRLEDDCPLFTSWAPAETDAQDERMRDLFSVAAD